MRCSKNKGLDEARGIHEKYRTGCRTDASELNAQALCEVAKKLQRSCEAVGARTSTTPAAAALVSSEALTVMTRNIDGQDIRFHHCCSCNEVLERDNRGKKGQAVRIFNPLHVLGNKISVAESSQLRKGRTARGRTNLT